FANLSETKVEALVSSADIIAQKQITNTTSNAKQISLFVVLYDPNHKMIDYSTVMDEFAPWETKTLSTGFTLPDQVSGYSLKAFIWDNLDGMKPLSDAATL